MSIFKLTRKSCCVNARNIPPVKYLLCCFVPRGWGYLSWLSGGGGYLLWLRVPTLNRGISSLCGGYLSWPGCTYPGWGYLPWLGSSYLGRYPPCWKVDTPPTHTHTHQLKGRYQAPLGKGPGTIGSIIKRRYYAMGVNRQTDRWTDRHTHVKTLAYLALRTQTVMK